METSVTYRDPQSGLPLLDAPLLRAVLHGPPTGSGVYQVGRILLALAEGRGNRATHIRTLNNMRVAARHNSYLLLGRRIEAIRQKLAECPQPASIREIEAIADTQTL